MKPRRMVSLGLIVVAAVCVALLADRFGGLTGVRPLEDTTLDWRQPTTAESFVPGFEKRPGEVVLVLFDRFSVTDSAEGWVWEQPFPRSYIAAVVNAVAGAGARAIGIDVWLESRKPRLSALDNHGDEQLHDAIANAGNVILVGPVQQTDSGPAMGRVDPYFADVAAGVGAADLPSAFETVRDGALAVRAGNGLMPSFALALYAEARDLDVDSLLAEARASDRLSLPGLPRSMGRIPDDWWSGTASAGNYVLPFTLRYVGPPSSANADDPVGTFPAVASSTVDMAAMLTPELFRDKIVLVGSGFHDSDKFRTPFFGAEWSDSSASGTRSYDWMYGVEVHANALQDMLDGEYARPLPFPWVILLLTALALATGAVVFWRGATQGGAATVLAILGVLAVAFWMWAGRIYFLPGQAGLSIGWPFLWVPVVAPALAAILSYVGSVAYVSVVEGREKRFIKGAFGKYVSPEVVAEIAEHPELLQLGGQKTPLTLLFSDLAGFTTMSEQMDPQDLLAKLNEYLSAMTQIVLDEKGTLDKYIGDAIMAFWNAPKEVDDHADRALRTAVLMQRKMRDLNERWRESDGDGQEFVVRIGINTGLVVVGNMGGENKFDYSAVGDAVNLAARLEPANKSYDTLIMASEFTLDAANRTAFRVRELDLLAVKGKVEPVTVYEVLEMAGAELAPEKEEALRQYDAGLTAYKSRDWTLAARYFEAALEADPGDGPSRVYLGRALEYADSPPASDWDFVVRRTVK